MNAKRAPFEAPKSVVEYASAGFAEAVKMPRAEARGASRCGVPGMACSVNTQLGRMWCLTERLGGGSPLQTLVMGTVSRTARVSTVRWNPKEAVSKVPARRTVTA